LETLTEIYNSLTIWQFILIGMVVLLLWFLPAVLALFFNPKHAKYILVACVPAGFSFIAWGGVMVWAVTGKVFDRFKDKVKEPDIEQESL
jgi:hypothetical protein